MENLVISTRKVVSSAEMSNKKKLEGWNIAIKIYFILVEVVKTFNSSNLLSRCLKNSINFFEVFIGLGMPLMDKCFPTDKQEVMALMKNLQSSTRYIQIICTHAKLKQDAKLMQFVPSIKKHLESLVFRVKVMLTVNDYSEGFWMGDLKNKDLQGKELQTQVENSSDDDSSTEPIEGDQSDVDLDEEETSSKDGNQGDSNYSASF